MDFSLLGWAIAFVLALLFLRALAWYTKRQGERRRYTQGVEALYASFRAETDPHVIARGKVRVLHSDANFILTRAYRGEKHSRRVMRKYGMSARRWNTAYAILKEIDAMPLGQQSREESYHRLRERIRHLYEAASVVQILPFD